jgi:hypothetical protein
MAIVHIMIKEVVVEIEARSSYMMYRVVKWRGICGGASDVRVQLSWVELELVWWQRWERRIEVGCGLAVA